MERGDVFVGPFAYADADRSKPRPVCVLSTGAFNEGPDIVVAMITSSALRLAEPGPGDVVLRDWQAAGLRRASTVRTGRLQTMSAWRLSLQLGRLSSDDTASVDRELRALLGLD